MTLKKSVYLVLLVLFLAIFAFILTYSVNDPNAFVYADDAMPVVSISAGTPASNKAKITVSLSNTIAADVKVKVVTRDYTAISGIDYTKKSITVRIPANSKSAEFNVDLLSPKKSFSVTTTLIKHVRKFIVRIVSVETENAIIADENGQAFVNCPSVYDFNAKTYATWYYFNDYATNVSHSFSDNELGGFWTSAESHTWTEEWDFKSAYPNLYNNYVKSGVANLYWTASGKYKTGDSLQWDSKIAFYLDNTKKVSVEIDGYYDTTVNLYELNDKTCSGDVEFDGDTSYPTTNDASNPKATNAYHNFSGDYYYKVESDVDTFKYEHHINGGYWRTSKDVSLSVKVADVYCSNITGWYIDEELYEDNNQYLYLRVRFDEPVQVHGKPTLTCALNNSSNKNNYVTFNYYDGSMTDTLVFRLKITPDTVKYNSEVTSVMPKYFDSCSAIGDFGYSSPQGDGCHKLTNADEKSFNFSMNTGSPYTNHLSPTQADNADSLGLKCKFDPRTPIVQTATFTNEIIKTFSTDIVVNDMSKEGNLYYEWSTNGDSDPDKLTNTAINSSTDASVRYSISAAGLSGEYYLYLQAVSRNKYKSELVKLGPLKFDNLAYTITYKDGFDEQGNPIDSDLEYCGNPYSQTDVRTIKFTMSQQYSKCDSGVGKIYCVWSKESIWSSSTTFLGEKLVYDISKGTNIGVNFYDKDGKAQTTACCTLDSKTDTNIYSMGISVDAALTLGMAAETYDKYYIGFVVIDKLDNSIGKTSSTPIAYQYYFDRRKLFESTPSISINPFVSVDNVGVYDYSTESPEITIQFATPAESITEIIIKKPSETARLQAERAAEVARIAEIGSSEVIDESKYTYTYDRWFNANYATKNPTSVKLTLKNGVEDIAGYYTVSIKVDVGLSGYRYTNDFAFYLTNNKQEITNNYATISQGKILTNKVYILSDTKYYYRNKNSEITSERYAGQKTDMIFSSEEECQKYLTYLEKQDMSLLYIDSAELAGQINGGQNVNYLKGINENTTAEVGQTWIKYKRTTWSDSTEASDWGLYWLSNYSTSINEAIFSSVLNEAISTVVKGIMTRHGQSTYLTSYNDYLDENGSPKVAESQIHPTLETASKTKSEYQYITAIKYEGDSGIYSPNITYMSGKYTLASTMQWNISEYSRSFIYVGKEWKRITKELGTSLKSQVTTTGVYKIREIDENGVREYDVFIDEEAGTLVATLTVAGSTKGISQSYAFNKNERIYDVAAQTFTINDLTLEYDTLAYVMVYQTAANKLLNILSYSDIKSYGTKGGYKLNQGRYYLKIYDRTGNNYQINLVLNSTDLVPSIEEDPNQSIKLIVPNRTEEDIKIFEVYLDGEKLEQTFVTPIVFKDSGIYTFVIQDWYGNSKTIQYNFERTVPVITWKYYGTNGQLQTYFEESTAEQKSKMTPDEKAKEAEALDLMEMEITKVGDLQYRITTSSNTIQATFPMSAEYAYEFVLEEGETAPHIIESTAGLTTTVLEISSDKSWTLKVSYKNYPNIYGLFEYILDNKAPSVYVGYIMKEYEQLDDSKIKSQLDDAVEGQTLTADTVKYAVSSTAPKIVINGTSVTADFMDVTFEDASTIKSVKVFLNGELIQTLTNKDNGPITKLTLTRSGSYEIEAKDSLNNVQTFKFKNLINNGTKYAVDDVDYDIETHVNKDNTTDFDSSIQYGHINQLITVPYGVESSIAYLITLKNGEQKYLLLVNSAEYFASATYYVSKNTVDGVGNQLDVSIGTPYLRVSDSVDGKDKASIVGTWYEVETVLGCKITAKYDKNHNVVISVAPREDGVVAKIEAKVIIDKNVEPAYVVSELSTMKSDVVLKNSDMTTIKTNQTGAYICTNKEFHIFEDGIPDEVLVIMFNKSKDRDFSPENSKLIYSKELKLLEFDASEDAYYDLTIINKYGNITEYIIKISSKPAVTVYAYYTDGNKNSYSYEYQDRICANESIVIEVFSNQTNYTLTRDGASENPSSYRYDEGFYQMSLTKSGLYQLIIKDEYGNVLTREMEIKAEKLEPDADILFGWNEKALRRSENYTNKKLSLDVTRFDKIRFVSVSKDGNETILYDDVSEKPYIPTSEALEGVIGKDGTGKYTVIFRDVYGNKATMVVNYREETTLVITRITKNSADEEPYDLDVALSIGAYSNNLIKIATIAQKARLIINNNETTFPKTISFISDVKVGRLEYEAEYLDEYGFSYTFNVVLLRQEITMELDESVNIKVVAEVDTTRDNILIKTQEDTTTVYTINNSSETYTYHDGDILRADGLYRITETDFAGNAKIIIIKKDTLVEYKFSIDGNAESKITNGTVVNDVIVAFSIENGDTSYIKKIYKDGEVYSDLQTTKFSKAGKWEFILADEVGNETYYVFYLITHRLNHFNYQSPMDFFITSVFYTDASGSKFSAISKVENFASYSVMNLTDDGNYDVTMKSNATGEIVKFKVIIYTGNPNVTLNGCQPGEKTIETITLNGLENGDTVYVYKDGKLIQTIEISELSSQGPEISDGGKYKIVIVNNAGNETVLEFTRTHIANTAGSVLIIILMVGIAIALFVGILLRNRSKVDK